MASFKNLSLKAHQVSEVISVLAAHEASRVAEAGNILDVGLQPGRIGPKHHVDESREEVVSRRRFPLAALYCTENVLAAPGDITQLLLGHTLGVHLYYICSKEQ